ncbi:hypothetical protein Zm00014a_002306 [Zea mays]|uniref:Uncharacterized protein n=1 Tax=Zea mays TaxID=4577 RepID=A0A3L6F730_MAIZE|nr:hypothetical protein Zm00014a_002306 [Zea mays]
MPSMISWLGTTVR